MRGNRCLVRVLPALPLLSAAFLIMYLSVTPCFVTYICTDGHVHRCVYIYNTYIYIYYVYRILHSFRRQASESKLWPEWELRIWIGSIKLVFTLIVHRFSFGILVWDWCGDGRVELRDTCVRTHASNISVSIHINITWTRKSHHAVYTCVRYDIYA